MDIKHTILMITYNQEDYIKEALSCLFRQGVLPYEVFIADDCSSDDTRKIIMEFKKKYPEIIKPIFHEKNLGINQNLNYIIDNVKVNGDIINFLSGDDFYLDNMLITFNRFIEENSLNPKKEKFLILSNVLNFTIDNKYKEATNNYKLRGKNYIKLKLRNKIGNRYTGISRALYNTMGKWNLNIGLWADALHSFDLYTKCDKFYFINEYFPVYRLGSGVTTTKNKKIFNQSWIQVANYIIDNRGEFLDKNDKIYLKKSIAKAKIAVDNSFENKVSFFKYYILSFGDVLDGYTTLKSYIFEISMFLPETIKIKIKKLLGR